MWEIMELTVHGTLNRHFKIGLAHQLDLKPKEALGYCNNAVAICEARVQRLKEELAGAKSQQTQAELQGVPEASEKAGSLSVLKDESTTEGPEGNSELSAPADEVLPAKEDQEDIVVALEAEIKDIEESLLDLREKVGFAALLVITISVILKSCDGPCSIVLKIIRRA
jgi:hypothetical protein